jgi:hypothetical protein
MNGSMAASMIQPSIDAMMAAAIEGTDSVCAFCGSVGQKRRSVFDHSPAFRNRHCCAVGAAIFAASGDRRRQSATRLCLNLADQRPRNTIKPDNDAPWPMRALLPGIRADIDVNETTWCRALDEIAKEVWRAISTIVGDDDRKVEGEIAALTLLCGLGLILGTPPALDTEEDIRRRFDQDDSNGHLRFHGLEINWSQSNRTIRNRPLNWALRMCMPRKDARSSMRLNLD